MPDYAASNAAIARALMRDCSEAALATLQPDGGPFASYVTSAPTEDGSPLLLLSNLAVHSRNLKRDPRASLLFIREPDRGADELSAARLTLTGRMATDKDGRSRALFLARHPDAARYADFADFSFYRLEISTGHLVAGFGRIVQLEPGDLLAPPPHKVDRL